ncbi:MAG: alpha/beta hydrolase [Roseovarius sp.]
MRKACFLAIALLCLTGGGWFGLGTFERKAVYPFDPTRVAPAATGLNGVSEQVFRSSGHELVIWVAAAQPGKPTIFYLHGNAGNLANRAWRFQQFVDRGYGLIAPAYRGSSGSTGRPSEVAITRDYRKLYNGLDSIISGISPSEVIVYGESLGTGVALKLLDAPEIAQPAGVVLEAPYTSLPDVVRHVYPQLESLIPKMKNIWDSAAHAPRLSAPLLVLHGAQDDMIPPAQGRAVLNAAGSKDKTMYEVPGAGHSDTWTDDSLTQLWRFIDARL